MEHANSTKPSSASSVTAEPKRASLEFALPDPGDFQPLPTLVSLEHMQHRIRQLRACFPDGIPTAEERWRAKSDEPFRL